MGVYIKGMEMPKNCCGCVFSSYTPTGKIPYCKITRENLTADVYFNKRDSSCPLVPVTSHGDLIDRTEAIVDANERAYDFWSSDAEADATVKFLQEQISIIPAEEGE